MAQDHEYEVRVRWGETADELNDALDLADDYRAKMHAAYRSRDNILRQFDKLYRYHRETENGCACGKTKCETLAVINADWISDLIARVHERDVN
ncbi:Uncharacterised protein [Mycolicibacterium vanbaalenii]|uniref:Uncharacterized protein n=2 Tax=Mycolicibacterium vanbaalenii TaxID=110539 RepID=A0A5S9R9C6_MYCVN|nr:Uncharacterised protein [Mycolicibacterium vanbaalenii]